MGFLEASLHSEQEHQAPASLGDMRAGYSGSSSKQRSRTR